jgi:hypothetical protein
MKLIPRGEALVSTLGVTGGNKKSGLYEDGVRKDRLDNNDMIRRFNHTREAYRFPTRYFASSC